MPLSGFKDFQTGTVLSEGDIDNYLMQGVLVFATSSDRDTALGTTNGAGGLYAGRTVYLSTPNTFQAWNGSAWVNMATESYVTAAVASIRDPLVRLYMEAGLSMM